MDVMRIAGFAVAAALCVLLLRRMQPELGTAAALACGAVVLTLSLPGLWQIISGVTALAQTGGVSSGFLTQLMKVAGISLLMDFAAQTCRDAGENGLAVKTELAGRVLLLGLALPAMQSLLRQLMALTA